MLADRFAEQGATRTVSESAEGDRTWAYGHVIVDEAQELSAMMWRLLKRRCPAGSFTVVGDTAQTGSDAGARNWDQMLTPVFGRRWTRFELSVNYRTPAEIMAVAAQSLVAVGDPATIPQSARSGGVPPRGYRLPRNATTDVMTAIEGERAQVGEGRLAVIVPEPIHAELHVAVREHFGADAGVGVDSPIAVLTAVGAKGLEFDAVVVIEPSLIQAESNHGANHLYVALSRPTQRLLIIYDEPLPQGMAELLSAYDLNKAED